MGNIKEFKYKKVNNFLSSDEINLLKDYCKIKHRLNFNSFDTKQNNNHDTYFYGDHLMESLLLNKKKLMEKETGLELLPTYSFWRLYTKFCDLAKHKDRPSCEISVTVMIDSDKTPWPIIVNGNSIELQPGEAVIYMGCELEHWREEFKGNICAQVFLHYVDKNGPFKEWNMDKRPLYGVTQ